MYGGRAIDDFDRRVLRIYMDEYMGDFIFDTFQPFHFYRDNSVDYVIPKDGSRYGHTPLITDLCSCMLYCRDQYLEYIESLPLANTPEVFGLHANAEINYFTRATKDIWAQLVELQPQTADTGTGISREEFISGIASDIQAKLPKLFELDVVRRKFADNITPTRIVLLQELERFNKLIKRMESSLSNLQKVHVHVHVYYK